MSFDLLRSVAEARDFCAARRDAGSRLGFVPTMGALHEGHLALVRAAAAACDEVVVSVFVNPLQFNDPRDLERYPRDLEGDAELVRAAGARMLFTGTLEGFFPDELDEAGALLPQHRVDPGSCALGLEGEHRPGHFEGVATIVDRLFEVVQPEQAFFGAKDYQQCLVVRDLAARRGGPHIQVCPTVREGDGLARSSRNALLTEGDRARAVCLSKGLFAARAAFASGERSPRVLAGLVAAAVESGGLDLEYAAIRDPQRWTAGDPEGPLEQAVALVAARAGAVRLIDNLDLGAGGGA
ncbi:MAG: pantoate--beta-alanine ligase [Planctomycetes bacterium]|nr:pantoate--beta-alanine ligase [Planctomycetota bacterium]MDA0947263.1 pantoate--beta-alanine ligase [Planctomycetota bacterium]